MADTTRTITVEFKGETSHLSRAARKAADDVDDAARGMGRTGNLISGALSPFVDNDIAGLVAKNLSKIPAPALAAAAAMAALVVAATGVAIIGAAAGGALAVIGKWLYGSNPNSPMAKAVDEVRSEFQNTADTLRNAIQPVFDDLATSWGPIVIDMLHDLNDWIVNNRDQIRTWILVLARAFTQGVIVATYFGQALILLATGAIVILVNALGAAAETLGSFIYAIGFITRSGSMKQMGRDMIDAGVSATRMSDDIVEAGLAGSGALGEIRDGAREADAALDKIEGDRKVNVIYSSVGFEAIRRQGDQLAGVIRPKMASQSAGPQGRAAGPGPTFVINTGIGDPAAIAREIRRVLGMDSRRIGWSA